MTEPDDRPRAILRYAVLDRLAPDRVARLHRAVAGSLERAGAPRPSWPTSTTRRRA